MSKKSHKKNKNEVFYLLENGKHYNVTYDEEGKLLSKQEIQKAANWDDYFKGGEFVEKHRTRADNFMLTHYKEFTKLDFGVFFWLSRRMTINNRIELFTQEDIAQDLETDRANISRSLRKLEAKGIIKQPKKRQYYIDRKYYRYTVDRHAADYYKNWDKDSSLPDEEQQEASAESAE